MKNQPISKGLANSMGFILLTATFLTILYSIVCKVSFSGSNTAAWPTGVYASSDTLQTSVLTQDLLYQQKNFFDWQLRSSPYYPPSMLILFLSSLFTKSILTVIVFNAAIQMTCFLLITVILFKVAVQSRAAIKENRLLRTRLTDKLMRASK